MLFLDGPIATLADLLAVDNEVQDVAVACDPAIDIDLVCTEATAELGSFLLSKLQGVTVHVGPPGFSVAHLAAVNDIGVARNGPRVKLCQIVTHHPDHPLIGHPIKQWGVRYTLAAFYREASNRKAVDRYATKMALYVSDARDKWDIVTRQGLSVVLSANPAPGSMWPSAGTWGVDNISTVAGSGTEIGGDYEVSVAWVAASYNASMPNRNDAESGPSQTLSVYVNSGNVLRVDITSLNPPDGSPAPSGPSQGIVPSIPATGWQVLVGKKSVGGRICQKWVQNATPIPITQKTFTLPRDPVLSGLTASYGQNPYTNVVWTNNFSRW